MPFPGTTLVPIAFDGGLQSKFAKFSLDSPHLEDAINARYTVAGQLEKRTGFTAVSRNILGGGVVSAGAGIQVFNGELVLFDGTNVYSWQDDEKVWVDKGSAFSLATGQTRILNTKIATQSHPDAMAAEDLTLYVWEDNRSSPVNEEGVRYSVTDNSTGALVVSDQLLYASALRPKCVAYQDTSPSDAWVVTYEISSTTVNATMVRSGRPNITSTPVAILTDGQPVTPNTQTIPYDVAATGGSSIYVAYASTTGLFLMQRSVAFGSTGFLNGVTVSASTTVTTVSVFVMPSLVWVAWSDATSTYAQSFTRSCVAVSPTFTLQTQPSVNLTIGQQPNATNVAMVACEVAGVAAFGNYVNAYSVATVPTYLGQQRGVGLAGKIFTQDDNAFVTLVQPSSLQATYFTACLTRPLGSGPNPVFGLMGGTGFEVVAKHAPTNGGGLRTNGLLSESSQQTPGSFLFAGQRKGPFTSYGNAQGVTFGVAGYTSTFSSDNEFNSVSSNNNLHITGGVKKIYDGISVVEDNFHVWPELLALPAGATFPATFTGNGCSVTLSAGGSLTASSSYQYAIVYTWTDNYGQVHRSGVGVATTVTTTGDGKLTAALTIPTLRLTDKLSDRSPVSIEVYRTQANLPIFYKLISDASPLVNDVTKDFVLYTDSASDVSIGANENLYTGSQLSNIAPPGCTLISLFQNRLVINQNEDPAVVWYSQNKFDQSQYNTLPLDWNTSFVEGTDSRGGEVVTAIGLLDASLAIFKPTAIYTLSGQGPNALFTSGEFNDAQLLVSDTGCTNQNSLVFVTQTPKSPGGLLFKSAKGIYLLGRDSSLTYVGAPVEEFNDLTITSANLLAKTNEIVFTTLEGTALVYNYFFDTWTTWANLPAVDAVVWEDQLVLLKTDGTAMVQDITGTVYADTGSNVDVSPIQLTITTPWIKLSGLQGYKAVYNCLLLGQFSGPHLMTSQVRFNYNPSVVETASWNSSLVGAHWGSLPIWGTPFGNWGNTTFSTYQFQVNFQNTRCESVQITFSDSVLPDANGAPQYTGGYILDGLAFETMALPGPMRLPMQNMIGSSGNR